MKRATRAKVEKKKPWYADQLAAANLPTTVISIEALEAGLRWSENGGPSKKKSPPKPRRGKQIIDPKKGMVVSEAAAKALIANGAADRRPKSARAAVNAMPVVVHNPVNTSGDRSNLGNHNQFGDVSALKPAPTNEANYIFSRTVSNPHA